MFIYYARRFKSAAVGTRLIEVQCEKCESQYFFELARVGSGTAEAPYGIGTKRTARAAEERAQRDLAERLEQDAELVPCPKCDWINGTWSLDIVWVVIAAGRHSRRGSPSSEPSLR